MSNKNKTAVNFINNNFRQGENSHKMQSPLCSSYSKNPIQGSSYKYDNFVPKTCSPNDKSDLKIIYENDTYEYNFGKTSNVNESTKFQNFNEKNKNQKKQKDIKNLIQENYYLGMNNNFSGFKCQEELQKNSQIKTINKPLIYQMQNKLRLNNSPNSNSIAINPKDFFGCSFMCINL